MHNETTGTQPFRHPPTAPEPSEETTTYEGPGEAGGPINALQPDEVDWLVRRHNELQRENDQLRARERAVLQADVRGSSMATLQGAHMDYNTRQMMVRDAPSHYPSEPPSAHGQLVDQIRTQVHMERDHREQMQRMSENTAFVLPELTVDTHTGYRGTVWMTESGTVLIKIGCQLHTLHHWRRMGQSILDTQTADAERQGKQLEVFLDFVEAWLEPRIKDANDANREIVKRAQRSRDARNREARKRREPMEGAIGIDLDNFQQAVQNGREEEDRTEAIRQLEARLKGARVRESERLYVSDDPG